MDGEDDGRQMEVPLSGIAAAASSFTGLSHSAGDSAPAGGHDLLHDPTLVEDYSDILKLQKPQDTAASESNSGSVVLTPTESKRQGIDLLSDLLSRNRGDGGSGSNKEEQDKEGDISLDFAHDYDYSDSDFEDNLEQRLKDMHADLGVEGELSSNDKGIQYEEEEEEEEEYQELQPPKELDPEKLYALYKFDGPDPSHCQLEQDQSCILLNDQDAYWWLVKRCDDNKIGFAPAEILETFPERLARLNCWKNENMSQQSIVTAHNENSGNLDRTSDNSNSSKPMERGSNGISSSNNNKSVSFNDIVSYVDRHMEDDKNDFSAEYSEEEEEVSKVRHFDEFSQAKLSRDDDEFSEVVSDVSSAVGTTSPLKIKKVRDATKSNTVKSDPEIEQTYEDDYPKKIFEAPLRPFTNNKANMHTSTSENSMTTIGEYSPSTSSEMTESSPRLPEEPEDTESALIPSSRAIKNISKYVKDELSPPTEEASASQISRKESFTSAKASSSEEFYMNSERAGSNLSVSSTHSSANQQPVESSARKPTSKTHPVIEQMYNAVFAQMDDLMTQLDAIVERP